MDSKKQPNDGFAFGNQDKDKETEIPAKWLERGDLIIVKQESIRFVDGKVRFIEHGQPLQAYDRKMFAENMVADPKSGRTGFDQLGIKVTVLHDAQAAVTEDITEEGEEDQQDIIDDTINPGDADLHDEPEETNNPKEPTQTI